MLNAWFRHVSTFQPFCKLKLVVSWTVSAFRWRTVSDPSRSEIGRHLTADPTPGLALTRPHQLHRVKMPSHLGLLITFWALFGKPPNRPVTCSVVPGWLGAPCVTFVGGSPRTARMRGCYGCLFKKKMVLEVWSFTSGWSLPRCLIPAFWHDAGMMIRETEETGYWWKVGAPWRSEKLLLISKTRPLTWRKSRDGDLKKRRSPCYWGSWRGLSSGFMLGSWMNLICWLLFFMLNLYLSGLTAWDILQSHYIVTPWSTQTHGNQPKSFRAKVSCPCDQHWYRPQAQMKTKPRWPAVLRYRCLLSQSFFLVDATGFEKKSKVRSDNYCCHLSLF